MPDTRRRSYADLFRTPEFSPLFLSSSANIAAQTLSGLALATLVFRATDSPLLSALSMFGPALAQVLGATLFLSGADRLAPRTTLAGLSLAFAAATAALALPGLPVWAMLVIVLAEGLIASLGGGVRWGLLTEILSKDGYLAGRSLFNMTSGLMQIAGYATGGLLVVLLSPRLCLLLAAGLYGTAAALALRLTRRPPRAAGRPSVRATWRANSLLWSARPRRHLYLALWVPNGLVVGCESLFVSYDPRAAGTLFACAALGMLAGDVTVGRLLPARIRTRLGVPLLVLLAAPYLVLFLRPPLALTAVLVAVASVGFGASLVQQERLVARTPEDLSGHALGLHSAGMLTTQGLAALLAGTVAQVSSPATAMSVMAAGSLAVTLALTVASRRDAADGGLLPTRVARAG
ncbi:Integral membrane protein [Streptomyces ambofaciens ATCC 23877]|uniref:Integral membrane protein n=1 Tax=Streptomyces ambofaciens (strain ATCC 23877 / 3486 / DSM 40053 / JCM 4204 / NBRC 12836 / NRRL B-2516) TaxID=278992 RepID=A0A0K2ATJ5_STRA7|nr:MFS transporter [Streptomyces ambofaciens]AKZ56329.1 Integral membrane protein [Streptomyces ambofaciens ATCC 23877]